MSRLERELRHVAKKKSSGSRTPSRSSSARNAGLKSPSMEPDNDEFDEELSDLNFTRLDELLRSRRDALESPGSPTTSTLSRRESRANSLIGSIVDSEEDGFSDTGGGDESGVVKIYSINDVISALTQPRSKISSVSREFLFEELYRMIIRKPLPVNGAAVNEIDLSHLISFVRSSRSPMEFILALRTTVAYIASDSDEVATMAIEELFPVLLSKMYSVSDAETAGEAESEVKASCVIAYASLVLVIFDGSDCYGLEDNIDSLVELAEGYGSSSESLSESDEDVVVSALNAAGVVLSLLYKAGRNINELIQETTPRVLEFLSNGYSKKVQKAAAMLIALAYESFEYDDDEEEEEEDQETDGPYFDLNELKDVLTQLVRDSSKKVSKKDKRDSRSIFREVLKTIESFTDPDRGILEDEKDPESLTISRFRLNKSKALPIKSWFEYIRLIHLKYIFGSELNLHYVTSKELRNLLVKPDDVEFKFQSYSEEGSGVGKHWKQKEKNVSGIKGEIKIKEARELKTRQLFGDLSLEESQ